MKTIKVIDLLNKIANGEPVPKKIKYKNEVREYVYGDRDYVNPDSDDYYLFYSIMKKGKGSDFANALNDEVEITKDTPEEEKKIEKLKIYENMIDWCCNGRSITDTEKDIIDKINEIIDKINGE